MLTLNVSNWRTSTLYVNTSWSIFSANWQVSNPGIWDALRMIIVQFIIIFKNSHVCIITVHSYYIILKCKGKKTYVRRAWSNLGFVRQDPLPWVLQSIILIPVLFSHLEGVFFFSMLSFWLNFPPFSPKLRKDSFALKKMNWDFHSPQLVHTMFPPLPLLPYDIPDGNLQSWENLQGEVDYLQSRSKYVWKQCYLGYSKYASAPVAMDV